MVDIKDFDTYVAGLKKGMDDKLWFLRMLPDNVHTVYDYGCADGSLLATIHELRPDLELLGYDINKKMVELASEKVPQATISSQPVKKVSHDTIVVCSSVIHEIEAYSKEKETDYKNIFECGAGYIAIRDMFYSYRKIEQKKLADEKDVERVRAKEPAKKIEQFEALHGPIKYTVNLLHYLLKYRYEQNWEREVRENYFPYSLEEFLGSVVPLKYRPWYVEHYTLPFLKQKVFEDFGITIDQQTHAKILLGCAK